MTTMTRKQFKEAKLGQQRAERFHQLKQVAKKTVLVGGILVTILTYTFSNGSILEVQAKGQEVIESNIMVQKGYTLSRIADMTGTTVQGIQALNHLEGDRIYEGQMLRLPTSATVITTLPKTEEAVQAKQQQSATYVVKKGDNLTKISKQTGVSIETLRGLNNLVADLIFEGETLKLTGEAKKETNQTTKPTVTAPTKETSKHVHEDGRHVVKSGESLYRIAIMHGLSVEELKKMNNLEKDYISVNTKLIVIKNDSHTVKEPTSNSIIKLPAIVYTVKAGDTMYHLEQKFDISRDLIMEWNNKQYANLIIGERLVIYGEAYQALAEFNGSVDNHSVEVTIDGEEQVLQLDYNEASTYDQYMGKQKSIQWMKTPTGEPVLVNVK